MKSSDDSPEDVFVKRAVEIVVIALIILTGCSFVIISFAAWLLVLE